ncbi:MAG: MFS transporter [Oscillospiraceae bacterium]|nr:MFS transporter [Oscillospiraceae bacterium]
MFIISGVAIGCSTLLIYLKVKDTTPVKETSAISEYQSARGEAGLITVLKENPVILLYVVAMALNTSAYRQFSYLMPLDLGRVHGEEGALIFGTVNSLNCLIVILCTPLITTWFTRLTETKKTMAGFLLQTVGFVVFASMLGHIPWYYAAIILFTWGEIFTTVASGPYISSRVPASHRGRMNGVFSVIVAVFMSVSQLITGHLFDTLGSTSAWIFTYAIDAGAIVLCIWLIFSDRKRYPKLYVSPADRL